MKINFIDNFQGHFEKDKNTNKQLLVKLILLEALAASEKKK